MGSNLKYFFGRTKRIKGIKIIRAANPLDKKMPIPPRAMKKTERMIFMIPTKEFLKKTYFAFL